MRQISAHMVALIDNKHIIGSLFVNRATKVPLLIKDEYIQLHPGVLSALFEALCTQTVNYNYDNGPLTLNNQRELIELYPGYTMEFFHGYWIGCRIIPK